jgi:Flp pilus assembly pilin Flp
MTDAPLIKSRSAGQAIVEYILLLVVMVAIITTIMNSVKTQLFADEGNCVKGSKSFICLLSRVVKFGGEDDNNFKYFSLKR